MVGKFGESYNIHQNKTIQIDYTFGWIYPIAITSLKCITCNVLCIQKLNIW